MTTTTTLSKARWAAALLATTTVFALTLSGCTVAAVAADPLDTEIAADAGVPMVAEPAPAIDAEPAPAVAEAPARTAEEPRPSDSGAADETTASSGAQALVPTAASTDDPDPQNPLTLTFSLPEANVHGWYVDDLVATVRVTSSISSNPLVEWTTSGAQSGSGESLGSARIPITTGGETLLTVTAVDEEGNSVGPVTRRIKLDKTHPVVTLLSPTRPVYRLGDSVTLQFTCDDPESGMNTCGATIINNTTRSNGYVQVLDQLGTFEARAHGSNEAGHFSANPHSFRVIQDESVAPTVSIDAPGASNGWWQGPATVTLTADDGDGAGVRRVEYRTLDDGVPGPWIGVDGPAASFTTAGEGDNRYQVRAIDWFDNVGAAQTVSFPTDSTAPSVTVSIPEGGVTVEPGDELVLNFDCTDAASGVEVCEAPVGEGEALDTDELGTFEVVVRAVDAAGNETRVVRSYTVAEADAAGPEIEFSAPGAEPSGWYLFGPSVTVTATDASAIEIIEWEILSADGSLYTEGSRSGVDELVVAGTDFPDGVTTLRVRAVDALGNATVAEFTVRVDGDAPAVRVVSPTELDELEQGSVVPFVFVCEDDASGVATCESSVGDVLPTGALGEQLVTITATDVAGQSTTVELAYTVVPAAGPGPGAGAGGGTAGAPALAYTGADTVWLSLLVALGLLVVGGAAVGSATVIRRQR